jgi:hypothetical protein
VQTVIIGNCSNSASGISVRVPMATSYFMRD